MQTNPNRSNNNRPYSTNCTCLATLTTMPTMATIDRPCPTSLAISVVMTAFISSLPKRHNKFVVATDPNTINSNSNTETICNHRPLTASSATTPNYNSSANRMAITAIQEGATGIRTCHLNLDRRVGIKLLQQQWRLPCACHHSTR